MTHPFASKTELTTTQLEQVAGAAMAAGYPIGNDSQPRQPIFRPPVESTMAIGEEGGSIPIIYF